MEVVALKNAEAYCETCQVTRRFVIPKARKLQSIKMTCGLCLAPLKLKKASSDVPPAPESGAYLIPDKFRKAV